jgi:hypothetical protein
MTRLEDLLAPGTSRRSSRETEPLTLDELRKAVDTIRYGRAFDRCPPHVVAPGFDFVLEDPLPSDVVWVGCANLCGSAFPMRHQEASS